MGNKPGEFTTIAFEDGTCAVVRTDPSRPRVMEVIATFYDAARARNYAEAENSRSYRREEEAAPGKKEAAQPKEVPAGLSERQQAVLKALLAKMDENRLVEMRAAPLAQAAQIPLGSLHSILGSLEKRHLIHTNRPGSARAPAIYQVLDRPKESIYSRSVAHGRRRTGPGATH